MWWVHFLIGLCPCLTRRYQRYPGDVEWHGHQRHRRNTEAVLQGAAGASAHRPPLPRLHGGHRCVTFSPGSVCLSPVGHFRALDLSNWKRLRAKSCLAMIGSDVFFLSLAALSDPAAKENCMMHLLRSLPDPNLMTFLTLLEHLKRYTHTQ